MRADTTYATDVLATILDCSCTKGAATKALIEETDPGAITQKIFVDGLNAGDLVLRIDEARKKKCQRCQTSYNHVTSLLIEVTNVSAHRLTDAVLLRLRQDGKYDCLYVDLKSTSPSGFESQFKSTGCAIRYVLDVLRTLHGKNLEIQREKFILVQAPTKGSPLFKQPVKQGILTKSTASMPLRIYRKSGGTVLMSELLAG